MVAITALWLPILLSAVVVFLVSSVIHMATPWHRDDFRKIPAEDDALEKLRSLNLEPGDYTAPYAGNMDEMSSDEFAAKVERGPQVVLTVFRPGRTMAQSLLAWFVFLLVIGVFAAYVAGTALGPGADYMLVFRLTSTVAFASHALAVWLGYIWYSQGLGYTVRTTIDGLIFALVTGGLFGWLWPA